jgi:hypothetical protein
MLLADSVYPTPLESFYLFTIGRLEWSEYGDIARLELVGCVRGETT